MNCESDVQCTDCTVMCGPQSTVLVMCAANLHCSVLQTVFMVCSRCVIHSVILCGVWSSEL